MPEYRKLKIVLPRWESHIRVLVYYTPILIPQTPDKTLIGLYIETRKARPKYTFMIDKK